MTACAADSPRPLRVGVSCYLPATPLTCWGNGGAQNIFFLYLQLTQIPGVHAYLVNYADARSTHDCGLDTQVNAPLYPAEDIVDSLDVLIESGIQLPDNHIKRIRQRGGRSVLYQVANSYVINAEKELHQLTRDTMPIRQGQPYDAIWIIPQLAHVSRHYLGMLYRCPVHVLPHIWEPNFLRAAMDQQHNSDRPPYRYQPTHASKRRLVIFEPNLDLMKTAHYPMLVCEAAWRQRPDLIEHIHVTNCEILWQSAQFRNFADCLDSRRVTSFFSRQNIVPFMAQAGDIVVSHQWELELNYLYYDLMYADYPIVHNSTMMHDAGYVYQAYDPVDGARALLAAIEQHDAQLPDYRLRSQRFLQHRSIHHPDNIQAHHQALRQLFG